MPALFLFIPLAGIFIQNVVSRKTGEKIAVWVTGAVCILQMIMALTYRSLVWKDVEQALNVPFEGRLFLDLISAVVLFTISMISLLSVIVSSKRDSLNFTNLVLISMMGMGGIAMVGDLFTLYIFLEITGVASYVMIAIRKDRNGFEGAFKYLVMSAVATVMLLTAICLLYMTVKKLDYPSIAQFLATAAWPLHIKIALMMLTAGLCIKAGVVPFHGWVPGAYTSAPPAVSVMLAGIVTKASGVYTIMRIMKDVFWGTQLGFPFMVLGTVSIVVGALAAIGQKDMKNMLSWSSISQVGYIVLAAGLGTPLALTGALLHFFNHATFKSLLFVNSAAVEEMTGTREMDRLGGLASKMTITGGTSVVGFLSTAGIPPLSGFWSKLLIILALFTGGAPFYAVVALLSSLITLAYFLIMQRKVFFGKLAEGLEEIKEGGLKFTVPALILAGITVAVGVLFPFVLLLLQKQGLF